MERVIAVSPYLKEQMQVVAPNINIEIIGNIVNPEFFEDDDTNQKEEKPVDLTRFFTIGITPLESKGVPNLLKAARIIKERCEKPFEIVIGGGGSSLPYLKQLAMDLSVEEQCHFLGGLSHTETRHWMRTSDIFVLPSLGETFSVATAEAMACGKPAIVTRCGGPEFFTNEENGILIPKNDVQALANAMLRFINNEFQFDAQKVRQSIATRFHPEVFVKDISKIYESVEESYLTGAANIISQENARYTQDLLLLVDYSNIDPSDTGKLFEIVINATRVFFPGIFSILKDKGSRILKYFSIGIGLFLLVILLSLVLIALGVWFK
jgi:glycosyltransferase involved in cell wall biosynthesis